MTQLDDLAFSLLAAGVAQDAENNCAYLLFIDPETSSLVSKPWSTGGGEGKLGHPELIAESVRPNSQASYILGPSVRLVVYVSSDGKLRVTEFDKDSDEWIDDDTLPQYMVHDHGHVAAILMPNGSIRIIFQDSSKHFTVLDKLDGLWTRTPTTLPVEPADSGPIGMCIDGEELCIFYVSGTDNCLHYVAGADGGNWKDETLAKCVFQDESKPKRFAVLPGVTSENWFVLLAMSEKNTLWQFKEGMEELKRLGEMNGTVFKPDDSEECFFLLGIAAAVAAGVGVAAAAVGVAAVSTVVCVVGVRLWHRRRPPASLPKPSQPRPTFPYHPKPPQQRPALPCLPKPPQPRPTLPCPQPRPTLSSPPTPPQRRPVLPSPQPPQRRPTLPSPQPPQSRPALPSPQPPQSRPALPSPQPPQPRPALPSPQPPQPPSENPSPPHVCPPDCYHYQY